MKLETLSQANIIHEELKTVEKAIGLFRTSSPSSRVAATTNFAQFNPGIHELNLSDELNRKMVHVMISMLMDEKESLLNQIEQI